MVRERKYSLFSSQTSFLLILYSHFKSSTEPNAANPIPKGVTREVCLAVTPQTIRSFKQAPPKQPTTDPQPFPGDFSPFIHVIDKTYTPDSENSSSTPRPRQPKNLKEYKGNFLLPLHLVFPELYALKSGCGPSAVLQDMWAIGTRHPWGIYTGPTTGVMRRGWRELGVQGLAGVVTKAASEHQREESANAEAGS